MLLHIIVFICYNNLHSWSFAKNVNYGCMKTFPLVLICKWSLKSANKSRSTRHRRIMLIVMYDKLYYLYDLNYTLVSLKMTWITKILWQGSREKVDWSLVIILKGKRIYSIAKTISFVKWSQAFFSIWFKG